MPYIIIDRADAQASYEAHLAAFFDGAECPENDAAAERLARRFERNARRMAGSGRHARRVS